MSTLKELEQGVIKIASDLDTDLAITATAQLCDWLRVNPDQVNSLDQQVVKSLKNNRQFEALQNLCDTLVGAGHGDPLIRVSLAQSLIDKGSPAAAIDVLRRVAEKKHVSAAAKIEANGLIGRSFKDLFLRCDSGNNNRRSQLLNLAIEYYAKAYNDSNMQDFWTGENLLALLNKAERQGIVVNGKFSAAEISENICEVIEKVPEIKRNYWHWASRAVVEVGRTNWDQANTYLAAGLKCDVTAFELGGTIRQLREMWNLDDQGGNGASLLVALQARLLQLPRGQVELTAADMQAAREIPEEQYEKIFGANGPQTRDWMQSFLDRGESVGLVCKLRGQGVGTCFVVAGEDFHDSLKGERLILTNDHVVSSHPEYYRRSPPLTVDRAEVSFEVFSSQKGPCRIAAKEIVWSSNARGHDACLIRLKKKLPEELQPIPITAEVPAVDKSLPEGVYIIGHPGGRSLSYSMQNNELLDHDCRPAEVNMQPRHIHYVTPTERGSSGSPAMNEYLEVIGLHHAGSTKMRMLNDNEGTYSANEAVWIQSICQAVRADLDAGRTRWGE